jgi:hypothetical protein
MENKIRQNLAAFILNLLAELFVASVVKTCQTNEFCQNGLINDLNTLLCSDFTNFSQLKSFCRRDALETIVYFHPRNKLVINSDLDLLKLTKSLNISLDAQIEISFQNVLGFDVEWFKIYNRTNSDVMYGVFQVKLHTSNLEFFYRNDLIQSCNDSIFDSIQTPIFSSFFSLSFSPTVKYKSTVCPQVFMNSQLDSIIFFGLVDHFIKKNVPDLDKSYSKSINSRVNTFCIDGYNYELTKSLINPSVLESTYEFLFEGTIKSIEVQVFKELKFVKTMDLVLSSLKNLYHQIGIEWTTYLNFELKPLNVNSISLDFISKHYVRLLLASQANIFNEEYLYPDEDFCIFKNFPHQKLLYPYLSTDSVIDCTCTILYLQKYSQIYAQIDPFYVQTSTFNSCMSVSDTFTRECNKTVWTRPQVCKVTKISLYKQTTNQDLLMIFLTAKLFVSIILSPLACLVGFYLNSLIIRTIANHKFELKERLYEFMSLNSKFNCVYCVIFVFNLMSECILVDSLYCSTVRQSLFVQYFKIIVINYVGNVIKMCSNITYILMTINRYMLIGKDHIKMFEKISKLSLKKVHFLLMISSTVSSLPYLYEYVINVYMDSSPSQNFDYPMFRRTNNYGLFYIEGPQIADQVMLVLVFFSCLFNFVLISFVNCLIEVILVVRLSRELRQKRQSHSMPAVSALISSLVSRRIVTNKKKHIEQQETRAIIMIITNSSINMIFHLPDVSSLFFFIADFFQVAYKGRSQHWICVDETFCLYIVDVSNIFFILTLSTNFAIFYFFNLKFKMALKYKSTQNK